MASYIHCQSAKNRRQQESSRRSKNYEYDAINIRSLEFAK